MLRRHAVDRAINIADKHYNAARSTYEAELFAKLALIEICGWIEENMDSIILKCSTKSISDLSLLALVKEETSRTYSFTYENHFRPLLVLCIGLLRSEKLEKRIHNARFQKMKASLGQLKAMRDNCAHTHIPRNVTRTLHAPSRLKSEFENVYLGLKDIADYLN